MVLLMVRREGVRVLHFVTLVPTVLAVAFLLRPAAPVIDQYKSARSVHARLVALGEGQDLAAVFHVRRELAYGLNFYCNKPISYYGPDGPSDMPPKTPPEPPIPLENPPRPAIPIQKHILIVQHSGKAKDRAEEDKERKELEDEVRKILGQRTFAFIGDFPPQHLEFFVVGPAK
jgi:hypothetical protein